MGAKNSDSQRSCVQQTMTEASLTLRDLTPVLTVWTQDDLIFIHERYRLQFTLIFGCTAGPGLGWLPFSQEVSAIELPELPSGMHYDVEGHQPRPDIIGWSLTIR
jgi:hypothetical protein